MGLPLLLLENNVQSAVWSSVGDNSLLLTTDVVEDAGIAFLLKPFFN